MFVKDGRLGYENNFFGKERDLITAPGRLPSGKAIVVFEYSHEDKGFAGGGSARLLVNGTEVARDRFAHVPPLRYSATETFDIGEDTGESVSKQYEGPNPFTGKLDRVTIELK